MEEANRLFKKHEAREVGEWAYNASEHRSFSYMDVTYKCGCTVRGNEAAHTCPTHWTHGIKRIVRVTEFY